MPRPDGTTRALAGVTPAPERARRRARQQLHDGPTGPIALHDVELENGTALTLALVEHPGAAAVVPFVSANEIVLIRQYRYAAGGDIWEVPAGKLDPGEDPHTCAARELEEETGYRANEIVKTGHILTTPGFSDEVIHLFCAFELAQGQADLQADELIERHVVPLERALDWIRDGELIDAKSIAALHHAARLAHERT